MSTEPELEAWRAAWTASASESRPPLDVATMYHRQQRRLRVQYISSLCAAVILFALPVPVLRNSTEPETIAWSAVVWLTTLGCTAFSIWNWRSLWQSAGDSVADFAATCQKRSLATIRAARFGYAFLVLQLAISPPWLTYDFVRGQFSVARYAFAMVILAALSAGFVVWFRRSVRSATRELANIEAFRRDCR